MSNIETVVQQINREVMPQFEERQRATRVHTMSLDRAVLIRFLAIHRRWDRTTLQREGLLKKGCPRKGSNLIETRFRSRRSEALLDLGKDILYGLLFGDQATGTQLRPTQREQLTLTVPRQKSIALVS